MIIFYGFELTISQFALLIVLLICFFYQLYYYLRYLNVVNRNKCKEKKGKIRFVENQHPVSVVICARDETENLRRFLPMVLEQEYSSFEVIVINDGGNEETEILLRDMKLQYSNLKSTFVPNGTTNLSTKKLALTLGIKAAQFEWILLTDADCVPESKHWIARMARNFHDNTDFVLGYGAYLPEKSLLNKLITYDTLFNGLQYLGFAGAGKPYMGVGRNMAYRREVFFHQKGFASTLHLRSGDDDLMVNQAANKRNTRVETSFESITWSKPHNMFRNWYYQKERHLSVSTFYRPVSKFRLLIEPLSRGLFYVSGLAIFLLALLSANYILAAVPVLLSLIRYGWQLKIINKSSKYFGNAPFFFTLPLFDILLPLISLFIMTFGRMGRKAVNISWK